MKYISGRIRKTEKRKKRTNEKQLHRSQEIRELQEERGELKVS